MCWYQTALRQDGLPFATAPAPRYTSSPTAVQFHEGVGSETVDGWIAARDLNAPLSLYLHIPFCEALCWYCGCHTTIPNGYARVGRFVETLHQEIDLWRDRLGPQANVGHIHFGGGTPNALSAEDTTALSAHLRAAFTLLPDVEIAAELDPRTLTDDRLSAFVAGGLNRASLGIQDFDETVQAAINRIQPFEQVKGRVEAMRGAGITALSFDLMFGLPHQTEESVSRTVDQAVRLGPDRLSVFGYAHVPWFAKHQKAIDEAALPGTEARFAQARAIRERLLAHGYVAIGLDHFARSEDPLAQAAASGTLRRNFQGYTTDANLPLIAMGPSAISSFEDGYAQNEKVTPVWARTVEAGRLPICRGVAVTARDHLRRRVIERLMCDFTVDFGTMARASTGRDDALDDALPRLRVLADAGLCRVNGRTVTVRPEARDFVRTIAQAFDDYSPAKQSADAPRRHARAI